MMKGKITDDKLKEKTERLKRPENCELVVPKVNPEIWAIMDHKTRSNDLRLQKEQKMLVKSACALTRVADKLVKSISAENKEQLKDILDALSLTLKTSHEISLDRRAKILNAPCVNKKYKKLGSSEVAITN